MRVPVTAAATALAALSLSACSGSPYTTAAAARYSSTAQVLAALKHGQMPCTGGKSNTPTVHGATSETLCNFTSDETGLIDVFPGTVSTATVLKNSVSTGSQRIWSDVGPNWWVQGSRADAERIQSLLGGQLVAGPWHPSVAVSAVAPAVTPSGPPDPAATACREFSKIYPDLSARLSADEADPSGLAADSTLSRYASDMSHWSWMVQQGADNGTSADTGIAGEFGDAGLATAQVADLLSGFTPDVESAADDVEALNADCSALQGQPA